MTESEDATVEYVIQPIPEADPDDRFIPHFTIHARRGDYTSGPFVWVTTEAEAKRVARAYAGMTSTTTPSSRDRQGRGDGGGSTRVA